MPDLKKNHRKLLRSIHDLSSTLRPFPNKATGSTSTRSRESVGSGSENVMTGTRFLLPWRLLLQPQNQETGQRGHQGTGCLLGREGRECRSLTGYTQKMSMGRPVLCLMVSSPSTQLLVLDD